MPPRYLCSGNPPPLSAAGLVARFVLMPFDFLRNTGRRKRLFLAFLPLLCSASAGAAAAPAAPAALATSTHCGPPPDTLALAPAPPQPDTVPPPRRARTSDYTVAPGETWHYERPRPFRWVLHIGRDLGQAPGYVFRRENTGTFVGLALSSAALWAADPYILDWSQDVGKQLGLSPKSTQQNLFRIPFRIGSANLPLEFNAPDNLNSVFYFLGDGYTHASVAIGFLTYGLLRHDNRAAQTASQLGTAILSTGVIVQSLKRLTGRQSPYVATQDRGEWNLFPSYSTYQSYVPNYDAFPTGHLATAMATVTVIADNYPEKHFIRPLGYGLMGLLGYSMLNNGVHWASDYPLGIALGYAFAKIAVRNGRTRVAAPGPAAPASGSGGVRPPRPQPWHRPAQWAPYVLGPYTGVSCAWRW